MKKNGNVNVIDKEFVSGHLKKRDENSSKDDYGRILLIAGSVGMIGSATLAARSAQRMGSGVVKLAMPKKVIPTATILSPETVFIKRKKVFDGLSEFDAVGIGPGLGVSRKTIELVKYVLENYQGNIVLDADALNAVAVSPKLQALMRKAAGRTVITPHLKEAARLLGKKSLKDVDRRMIAKVLTDTYGSVAVLKGFNTLVAFDEDMYVNPTGNPAMATAGSGDVLTGIIAALLGQGNDIYDAAKMGVFIHGLAGDLAKEKYGEYGVIARDILRMIPFATKLITEE